LKAEALLPDQEEGSTEASVDDAAVEVAPADETPEQAS